MQLGHRFWLEQYGWLEVVWIKRRADGRCSVWVEVA